MSSRQRLHAPCWLISSILLGASRCRSESRVQRGALATGALDLLGGLGVSYEGVELSYRRRDRQTSPSRLDDDLRQALQQLGELCQRSEHPGFVLRYDEFHVVEEKTGQFTLSALLSACAAVQQRGIALMLVLCGLPPILENLARSKSYTERMFTLEHLGNLRPPVATRVQAARMDPSATMRRAGHWWARDHGH